MGIEYFPCFHSYFRKCEKLTDQELGRLFRALMQFSATGERQELDGRESIAFDFIADDIIRSREAYDARCRTNKANVEKRYETKAGIQPNTTLYETYQGKTKDKSKGKTKDKALDCNSARFMPPTSEEVAAYCQERGGLVDPERWYAYYESIGWKVGKNPMKDWKAAVRTWERNGLDAQKQEHPKSFADMWRDMPDE